MKAFLTLITLGAGGYWLARKIRSLTQSTTDMKPQRTPLTFDQARDTFTAAFKAVFGRSPSDEETAVLLAQSAHETARWQKMFNWNWGGIKAVKNQASTQLVTKEGEGRGERTVSQSFGAYGNALSGAKEWLGLLSRKYTAALDAAKVGDPDGFARALKARGYFTGNVDAYAASMSRLYREFYGPMNLISPIQGAAINSSWGDPRSEGRTHQGVDIFADEGTPVVAVADGKASLSEGAKEGLAVVLTLPDSTRFLYAHLSRREGEFPRNVSAGETLGYVGTSGNASDTPPHLHFEMRPQGGDPVDPAQFLKA